MDLIEELWRSLLNENSRERLLIVGTALSALVGWLIYWYKSKKKDSNPPQVTAEGGSVAAGGNITVGGDLNVGLTEEKFLALLKERDEEIRKEYAVSTQGSEQRALLEKELADLEQKRTHLEESLKTTQKVYADTVQLLEEKLSAQLLPDRIEQAKTALAAGDPAFGGIPIERSGGIRHATVRRGFLSIGPAGPGPGGLSESVAGLAPCR